MTADRARKLIEEAREQISLAYAMIPDDPLEAQSRIRDADHPLREALSLLPEWQEFDPQRKETWPKERGLYSISSNFYNRPVEAYWKGTFWDSEDQFKVQAWMPLPQPYVKP